MKASIRQWKAALVFPTVLLGTLVTMRAMEPQTLFNFRNGVGAVTGTLTEGPDGNFYGTTAHGGPIGDDGTVFRVTHSGELTVLAFDQENPVAGLVVGNDNLLYGMTSAGGAFGFGTVFKLPIGGVLTNFATLDGTNGGNPMNGLALRSDGNFYGVSQEGEHKRSRGCLSSDVERHHYPLGFVRFFRGISGSRFDFGTRWGILRHHHCRRREWNGNDF